MYVPESSLNLYKTQSPWSYFNPILPLTQTSIDKINDDSMSKTTIYTLDGMIHNAPQKGLNIIRMSNGGFKKVIMK